MQTIGQAIRQYRKDRPSVDDPTGRKLARHWVRLGGSVSEPIAEAFCRTRASKYKEAVESHGCSAYARRMFHYYLAVWGHTQDNYDPSLPERPKSGSFRFLRPDRIIPTALSVSELGHLIASVDKFTKMKKPGRLTYKAAILTLYYTGVRVDMLKKAPFSSYDPESGRLLLIMSKGGEPISWDLPEDCRKAIEDMRKFAPPGKRGQHLFHGQLNDRTLKRLAVIAGLEEKVIGWHIFRRTSATHVAAALGPAAAASHVGHKSVDTTVRHYIDPRFVRPKTHTEVLRSPLPSTELSKKLKWGSKPRDGDAPEAPTGPSG